MMLSAPRRCFEPTIEKLFICHIFLSYESFMKSKRITCIISSLGGGGAERNLVRLSDWLTKMGHQVTILTLNRTIKNFYEVPSNVLHSIAPKEAHISNRWFRLHRFHPQFIALKKCILETEPNLVISFIDISNISVLMSLRTSKIPVIVSERIDPREHRIRWTWSLLRRIYYPKAFQVIIVAHELLQWATTRWPRWNVSVIPNAILPPLIPLMSERPKWFSQKNVVAMGRLNKQKGFDLLLQAFARIAEQFPEWNLTIMGEGLERISLETEILSLGLKGRVHLPGLINNPSGVLVQSDLFILSSLYEGFPNALAEAMACGLPVISFDCPSGPKEIIRNGIDGILVPVGNMSALSQAMQKLMADDAGRKRLASRAPEVLERFSQEQIIGMWQAIIDNAVSGGNA